MSEEELEKMDKEELLGIIKAQRFEISILKDDKEHLGEFLKEKEDEIERLQEDIGNYVNIVLHERKEIDRLHSIIKEVREYLESIETDYAIGCWNKEEDEFIDVKKDILEILDKENK